MPRTTNIFRIFVWGTLAAAAALFVAVPSALASPQYGPHDTWYPYAISLTQERVLDAHHHALILNARAQAAQQTQTSPSFTTDTLAPGGRGQTSPVVVHFTPDTLAPGGGRTTTVVTTGDGFNWSDAGVGAAIAIGAVLLASGAAVSMRRRGRLAF
jgi:hypothetical protein